MNPAKEPFAMLSGKRSPMNAASQLLTPSQRTRTRNETVKARLPAIRLSGGHEALNLLISVSPAFSLAKWHLLLPASQWQGALPAENHGVTVGPGKHSAHGTSMTFLVRFTFVLGANLVPSWSNLVQQAPRVKQNEAVGRF